MREFMSITRALADPNRVRMLLALQRGELCVCQITELFGLAFSTVSKHLSILQHAGLIQSRKSERCRARGAGLGEKIARPNQRSRRGREATETSAQNRPRRNLPPTMPLMN